MQCGSGSESPLLSYQPVNDKMCQTFVCTWFAWAKDMYLNCLCVLWRFHNNSFVCSSSRVRNRVGRDCIRLVRSGRNISIKHIAFKIKNKLALVVSTHYISDESGWLNQLLPTAPTPIAPAVKAIFPLRNSPGAAMLLWLNECEVFACPTKCAFYVCQTSPTKELRKKIM